MSKNPLLNENQYNLIVYCLENQWLEFDALEEMDAGIIIEKLKEVTKFKPVHKPAHTYVRKDLDVL